MMNTTATSPFTPETTIGEIVAARPALARVFERLGVDYCCGGKQPLAKTCARLGLEVATTLALLDAAGEAARTGAPAVDAASMTLTQLADHIEQTHHVYVKEELPRLEEMAARVAGKHGWRDPRLAEVLTTVRVLLNEMFSHMQKEEKILFPLVRALESGTPLEFHCGTLASPIRQMESEHEVAGQATARLRELTGGFVPEPEACNTHRALLAGLAEFEADLHTHVHKENSILFPRALARAEGN